MANFGAHTHYKLTIDTFGSAVGTWKLLCVNFMHDDLLFKGTFPKANFEEEKRKYRIENMGEVFNQPNYTKTAYAKVTEWGWVLEAIYDVPNVSSTGWEYAVASWGAVEFPSPAYIPIVFMQADPANDPITSLSFYYSDDGTTWTLIKTFTDATDVFGGSGELIPFILGDYYISSAIGNQNSLAGMKDILTGLTANNKLSEIYVISGIDSRYDIAGFPAQSTLADLRYAEWRYSGGSSNSAPEASLGGGISDTEIPSQALRFMSSVFGLQVIAGANNSIGIGRLTLSTDASGEKWVSWKPSGAISAGSTKILTSGKYFVASGTGAAHGYVILSIDTQIIADDAVYMVYVDNPVNAVFNTAVMQSMTTDLIQYRCVYLYNSQEYYHMAEVYLYLAEDTYSPSTIEIGIDPSGVGGEPASIANDTTAPVGVVFSSPDVSSRLATGGVPAGNHLPVWIKRTIPAGFIGYVPNDLSRLSYIIEN